MKQNGKLLMTKEINKMYEVLKKSDLFNSLEELDSYVHALVDIKEACDKVFNDHVRKIIKESITKDEIQNTLWDIREEFRHIVYHINDGKLDQ